MYLIVRVKGPGYEDTAELRDDRAECSYGGPVLVLRGKVLGPGDLTPGSMVVVLFRSARIGPAWALVEKARDAGFPVTVEPVG